MSKVLILLILFISVQLNAQKKIIVDEAGKGDYKTIQGAINSLPDSSATPRMIFIMKGTYTEKVYIEKSNIIFEAWIKQLKLSCKTKNFGELT